MQEKWYKFHFNQLKTLLNTDFDNGLDMAEAKKRLRKYRDNELFPRKYNLTDGKKYTGIGTATALLILISIIYYFISRDISAFFICLIAVVNYVCVYFAYKKSHSIIADSEKYSTLQNRVIRQGKIYKIDQKGIVPGDIILLSEGDVVPCDGRIISLDNFKVLEMNISGGNGEKDADFLSYAPSLPEKEQKNMVFAASIVFKGEAKIVACATGSDTVARRRGLTNRRENVNDFDLFKKAKKLADTVSLTMLFLVLLLTVFGSVVLGVGEGMARVFFLSLAFAASVMCEFFAIFAYIIVASGMFFGVRNTDTSKSVVIKNISSIEKMNRLTCLAIPKTSGICTEDMEVDFLFVNGREYNADAISEKTERFCMISRMTVLKNSDNSAEEKAILKLPVKTESDYSLVEFLPIGERSYFDTSLVLHNQNMLILVRGGLNEILNRCTKRRCGDETPLLEAEIANDYIKKAEKYQKNGYKVVAVASKKTTYGSLQKIVYAQTGLCFEGFLVIREAVVSDCAQTVKMLSNAGIRTLLFCDDISKRNEYLAYNLGIIKDPSQVITSYEFLNSNLNLQNIKLKNYTLFQGFDGKQKKYVLDRLRKNGEEIGVLGSTLTDVSLRTGKSVVSFSTGLSLFAGKKNTPLAAADESTANKGEVLKLNADAIIRGASKAKKSGINAVYEALKISARIYDNASRMLSYFFVSGLLRLLLLLLSMFTPLVSLTASQIIFSGLAIDLCGAFTICSGKDKDRDIKGRKKLSSNADALSLFTSSSALAVFTCLLLIITRCIIALSGAVVDVCDGCFTFAWMTSQLALIFAIYGKRKTHGASGIGAVFWVFALLLIELFFVSELVPQIAAFTAFGTFSVKYLLIASLPAIAILCVYFVPIVIQYIKKRQSFK